MPADLGFDARAVAVAVRRALGRATSWEELTFDVIPPVVLPPVLHVALDEVLPHEVASGARPPLLRIWDWDSPLVVIGSFQSVRNEIDPEGAARHGIGVVRRITGGGAHRPRRVRARAPAPTPSGDADPGGHPHRAFGRHGRAAPQHPRRATR